MEAKFYPKITLVVDKPGKDIYTRIAELKLKIYRILPKQNTSEIKRLFKNIENKEKCLQNRNKLEKEGNLIQTHKKRTKEILKGHDHMTRKLKK